MAEETKTEATAPTVAKFERDDLDPAGIDVNALPPIPWTRAALGDDVFQDLADAMGAGDLRQLKKAAIDPRSFGTGRAARLIEAYKLDPESEQAEAYRQEGAALQEAINATLPAITGTPRNPKAKPMTPATTTRKQGSSAPRRL